jgi:crotonobetaine/carnitine-CoA ligase
MNLSELLATQASKYPDKAFLLFERQPVAATSEQAALPSFRQTLTFAELDARVNQACHLLAGLGLARGDVFNLHLPNCPSFIILWFAAARLGAVMMPTNVLSSAAELAYLLEHSSSKVSFTTAAHEDSLRQCQAQVDCLQQIVLCDPYTRSPVEGSFEALLGKQTVTAWTCPVLDADMAAIMYTSGTTSKPKGVMVSHANYITAGETVANAIELGEQDRHFVVLPLFHGNAQYYSTMSALLRGASVALMDRFSASQYFDKCIEYQCTVASLFAAPMRMILAQAIDPAHQHNRLRIVIYAQSLTEQQLQNWQQRFDAPLCQIWGMTETMGPPLMNPLHGGRRNWTVGKASGDYEVELVDESGQRVESGKAGEIIVRGIPGKTIMAGYFKNPQASAETIRENWLYTGDNAIQDEAGYFQFVDRKKDMIKRSGENVSAGEVENVILQHPAVFECAVIGLPDDIKDESIVAVVVLKPGQSSEADDLIEFCAGKLASFRVPQRVVFKESLPKTSVGKIQKHLIREGLIGDR